MSDNPIDSFLAEIGFAKPDTAGARAVEDLVNRTETRITDIQAREGAKRAATEQKGQAQSSERINAFFAKWNQAEGEAAARRGEIFRSALADTLGVRRDHFDQAWKQSQASGAREVAGEREKAKKLAVVHGEQFKQLEAGALRLASVFSGVSVGLGAMVSAAPLGAFLTGVERTAAGLSRLDVQAKRTGSSAAGIQRFLFALKQQGVDEGEASGALEGFAKTMQSNPEGYRSALEGLPQGGRADAGAGRQAARQR